MGAGRINNPIRLGVALRPRAFTLLELLVTITIVAVLGAILLPAIGSTMKSARAFSCQMSLRSIGFDFSVFADDAMHGDRGDDETELGPHHFRLETFIESQYGVDEFWAWGSAPSHSLPDAAKNDPMRCAEVHGLVTVYNGLPCSTGAVTPPQHVSYGFNMRLHWAQVSGQVGQPVAANMVLSSRILQEEQVPLAWDVDGAAAAQKGVNPLFSAPTLGSTALYPNDQFWFPASRHQGRMNVVFTDGSLRTTGRPLDEDGWRWSYQPAR